MLKITLDSDVLKNATTVDIVPAGAISNFDVTGGVAYIGKDKFAYTSYSGATLTGCTGISWSHEAGERVYTYYGMRLRDILPRVLLSASADPDRVVDTIVESVDGTIVPYLKDLALDVHKNMDPNRADEDFLELICGNLGLEFNTEATEPYKRSLARQATNLLKNRGTEAAFRFIVWHLLRYRVYVDIESQKVVAKMSDSAYRTYIPATPFAESDIAGSYWKMEATGSGPAYIGNEIPTGPELELVNSNMFSLTTTSMFPKMTALTLNGTWPWAKADGGVSYSTNLHGKDKFVLKWFMKPATGGTYPQKLIKKGDLIQVTRPNATDLQLSFSDGTTTVVETVSDCVTEDEPYYVAIVVNKPSLAVVVNDSIQLMKTTIVTENIDDGSDWEIGDILGAAPYEGRIDTILLDVGEVNPLECVDYYDHIKYLKTYGTAEDRNCYTLNNADRTAYITIDNGDGDSEKLTTLAYLVEEWLTAGEYSIIDTGHLLLEQELGLWKGII